VFSEITEVGVSIVDAEDDDSSFVVLETCDFLSVSVQEVVPIKMSIVSVTKKTTLNIRILRPLLKHGLKFIH
jgi:hypothetical protein